MKRISLAWLSALVLLLTVVSIPAQEKDEELWKKANEIHLDAIVIDAHAHPMPNEGMTPGAVPENLDLGKITRYSCIDFISMKEGGLDAAFFSIPLLNSRNPGNPSKRILDDIALFRSHIKKYSNLAEIALSSSDIRRIHNSEKRAVLFMIESRDCLEGHPVLLEAYYKMGVRMVTITRFEVDPNADTDSDGTVDGGLSRYGKDVVQEMNRLGMLIDISHASDNLQMSLIEESRGPVIASHSCVRALNDSPREMPDGIIKKLARNGGAIMIAFSSAHLSKEYAKKNSEAFGKFNAGKRKFEKKFKDDGEELERQYMILKDRIFSKGDDIELLIDHIDHAVKVAGIDHVGLGSDYIEGIGNPAGLETAAGYPLITYHLLKRGYKAEDIRKILGENLLRILSEVQNLSHSH
ncbi:dipeptidase [Acidobacteriota bacterium]